MTTDLDRAVRSSLGDIIATAPEPDDRPMRLVAVNNETSTRRPYLAVAASLVVLAGVGGLVAIGTNDTTPVSPAAAPTGTDNPSAPAPATAPATTTVPGQTASSAVANTTPSCSITGAESLVPNVAGMSWVDAAAAWRPQGSRTTHSLSFPRHWRPRMPTTTSSFGRRLRPERSHHAAPSSTSRLHTDPAPSTSSRTVTPTCRSQRPKASRSSNSSASTASRSPNSNSPARTHPLR